LPPPSESPGATRLRREGGAVVGSQVAAAHVGVLARATGIIPGILEPGQSAPQAFVGDGAQRGRWAGCGAVERDEPARPHEGRKKEKKKHCGYDSGR